MDFVNCRKPLALPILMLLWAPIAIYADQEIPTGDTDAVVIDGVSETAINGIRFISPVTWENYADVIEQLHQSESLRALTKEESNALNSTAPDGSYFYVYGFQLISKSNPLDFIVSRNRGADRHQFEVQKLQNGNTVLLGFSTSKDVKKFDFYSKTYGPTPKLIPLPLDQYNSLLVLPIQLIKKIENEDINIDKVEVTSIDAVLLPKK